MSSAVVIRSRASDDPANIAFSEDASAISVLADDVSPIITQSQKLFGILQACAIYAASDMAVELWLDNERGRRSVAADMTDIANSGYDALITSIRYFQDTKLIAESLARDGGTTQIRRCEDGSEKFEDQMATWQKSITKMQKSVITVHEQYQDQKNEYDQEKEVHEAEMKRVRTSLDDKLDELETQMKMRAAKSHNHEELALGTALALWSCDWGNAAFQGGKLMWAMLPGKSSKPNITRAEIDKRRQEALVNEAKLTDIQISIEQIVSKTAKVEDFNTALGNVTIALASLIKQLKVLMGEFQGSLALISTFVQGVVALETNCDYSSERAVTLSDSETFFENIVEMRDRARQLQFLALLYGKIIKTIMLTGCNTISNGDYGITAGESARNAARLAITSGKINCVSIKHEIDNAYSTEHRVAARTVAQRREVFRKASELAIKPKSRDSLFRTKK